MTPTLHLRHRTDNRWRLVVPHAPEIDWVRLQHDLLNVFPESSWLVRINQRIGSIVICRLASAPRLRQDPLTLVFGRVAQQLNLQGFSVSGTPLMPTEIVDNISQDWTNVVHSAFRGLANAVSVSLSISTLLLSFAVFIIGIAGLFIPFSPGIWLLIAATALFDLAISFRRPFVV
ncbi:MAG: hypothetical protein VXZ59_05160 [Cyanobacteriota bacterium]|nr:hypothetical protein [Cyanobacteriota bacterium]